MSKVISVAQPQNSWIVRQEHNPHTKLRLFCFPYAGGGASVFRSWFNAFDQDVEVCVIQLPGRENRLREAPLSELKPLIESLTETILPYLDTPFAFFGYSMGSLISFELTRQLYRQYQIFPIHLFVAACRGVQIPVTNPIHHLPDNLFIEEVNRRYQGIPATILENSELMQTILPTLKADFKLIETHKFQPDEPLDCPITAFGGLQDKGVSYEDLLAWGVHTHHTFNVKMFSGEHFFLNTSRQLLWQAISEHLEKSNSKEI